MVCTTTKPIQRTNVEFRKKHPFHVNGALRLVVVDRLIVVNHCVAILSAGAEQALLKPSVDFASLEEPSVLGAFLLGLDVLGHGEHLGGAHGDATARHEVDP